MAEAEPTKKEAIVMEAVIVKSKVKAFVKEKGLIVSKDFFITLNRKVLELIAAACERTVGRRKKTLSPHDA